MCACPFCGGRSSLQFNTQKGLWVCFRCREKGSAKSLVEKLGEVWGGTELDDERLFEDISTLMTAPSQSFHTTTSIPESYLRRFSYNNAYPHHYWTRERGFLQSTCERWELGYDPVSNRCTIPIRTPFDKKLKGIIYRALDGSEPRYSNPPGFHKSSSLFGSWFCTSKHINSVALVEGPCDAVNVDQAGANVMAQYGSSLSNQQITLLHSLGIKRVCLFYDYDKAGIEATIETKAKLYDFEVASVTWNERIYCPMNPQDCKCARIHRPDPGMLTTRVIRKMLRDSAYG